jgi:hypothetical protein
MTCLLLQHQSEPSLKRSGYPHRILLLLPQLLAGILPQDPDGFGWPT